MVSNTSNPHQGQESISRNETAAQVEASRMNDTEIDDGVMQAGLKRLESSSREGNVGFLLEPSFQMLRSYYIMEKKRMPSEWRHFIFAYSDMLYAYDELGDKFLHVANQRCIELVAEARIPYLRDEMVTRLEDETEDFARKRVVRLKYQKAVEKLQDSLMPPRRRSNLPKEGVEYMKKWFRDRYDYPYPTEEEKKQICEEAKVDIFQLSYWFSNYRKRAWKPGHAMGPSMHTAEDA